MQKDGSDENKNYKFRNIAPENYSSKSKNVDINKLLNRVKQNSIEERKKKLIVLSLAVASISLTGLIVF